MRFRLRTITLAGILSLGGLAIAMMSPAHAGCGGGGGYRGGYGGGHTFGQTYSAGSYGGGGCCNMGGMQMGGMVMSAASMQGMNMGGYPAPATQPTTAAAGSQYFCPMHPNVVSGGPAICPYCGMVLKRR